jgi:hypothetical protein
MGARFRKRNPGTRVEYPVMALNTVNNNAPAHAVTVFIDSTVNELNQPAPKAPPGSIGHQLNEIKSQLYAGNPGGVGAGFGLGISLDTGA